jgi:hypothetical protein
LGERERKSSQLRYILSSGIIHRGKEEEEEEEVILWPEAGKRRVTDMSKDYIRNIRVLTSL